MCYLYNLLYRKTRSERGTSMKFTKRKNNLYVERHASIVHDGNRSFKCGICDTGFISKEYLNKQVDAIHEKKKKIKCYDSNIGFLG